MKSLSSQIMRLFDAGGICGKIKFGMSQPLVSIIIPVRAINDYLRQTLGEIRRLYGEREDLEVLVFTDEPVSEAEAEEFPGVRFIPTGPVGPAEKRNWALKHARGEIFAFLDDDSYPNPGWLEKAIELFKNEDLAGVCGPTLTPPNDNFWQRVTGLVYWSYLGSAGTGTYRNRISPARFTEDYQSANLLVRRRDFGKVGGFDLEHWPGEDTKLCMDLTEKLKKKILYHPKVLAFHHRRPILLPHLKQISRYALRSGNFARIFPETRWQIGFFMPTLFVWGLILGAFGSLLHPLLKPIYLFFLGLYLLGLVLSALDIFFRSYEAKRVGFGERLGLALLTPIVILMTHLTYGVLFPWGFARAHLGVTLHPLDKRSGEYVGG